MKRIILAAVAVSALAIAPAAFAADASATVTVGGTVTKSCGNGNQSGGGVATPSVVALGEIVDGNGQLKVISETVTFGNTWCNAPANLTVSATGFSLGGNDGVADPADASSFVNKLDLVVSGTMINTYMGGGQATTQTDKTASINQAFETGTGQYSQGTLKVQLPAGHTGDRPVAGSYSGSVTFTATPQ